MSISIISGTACKLKQPERDENELLTKEYLKRGKTIKKVPPTEMKHLQEKHDWKDRKNAEWEGRQKNKG
jgi:hypothetical protein